MFRALHHSSWHLALRVVILGLCASALPWKPISWSSWRTVLVLMWLPEAVWNYVVSVATKDRRFLRASTRRSHSVRLCGLPLRGWAVAPRHFHFTITALTVDWGSSSRAESLRTDLLEKWHPMTVPRWKSRSASVRPFYCQCFSIKNAWLCACFIHLSAACVAEIAKSTHLKGCPHFCMYSVHHQWRPKLRSHWLRRGSGDFFQFQAAFIHQALLGTALTNIVWISYMYCSFTWLVF